MSWMHALIIGAALAVDLVCGMFANCEHSSKSIDNLSTMVISGVLGNMSAGAAHKMKPKKSSTGGANA